MHFVCDWIVAFFSQNTLDINKMVHMYPIDSNLKPTGSEFQLAEEINYDEQVSPSLNAHNFDKISLQYVHLTWLQNLYLHCLFSYSRLIICSKYIFGRHPILVVKFYAPWCYWSQRLVFWILTNVNRLWIDFSISIHF